MTDATPNPDPAMHGRPPITIRAGACARPLSSLPLSQRLGSALLNAGVMYLGDLCGRSYGDLNRLPLITPRCLLELRALVDRINGGDSIEFRTRPPYWLRDGWSRIAIPVAYRDMPLVEFVLSVRLEGVLTRAGLKRMGNLHGHNWGWFYVQRGAGPKLARELNGLVNEMEAARCQPDNGGS